MKVMIPEIESGLLALPIPSNQLGQFHTYLESVTIWLGSKGIPSKEVFSAVLALTLTLFNHIVYIWNLQLQETDHNLC